MLEAPGEGLLRLCRGARETVVLVAPFIKRTAMERLLSEVDEQVWVRCITRWRPQEIIAGVSDIEVWSVLRSRGNSSFGLVSNLHAKYYRGDQECLVGSANITAAALGWSPSANLELLVGLDANFGTLAAFETQLLSQAVGVAPELYREYSSLLNELKSIDLGGNAAVTVAALPEDTFVSQKMTSEGPIADCWWIPRLRNPDQLFLTYAGGADRLSQAARADALEDLVELALPAGLNRKSFNLFVRWQLLQLPVVRALDELLDEPQRFGAIRDWLTQLPPLASQDLDGTDAWQRLMRWLLFFAGDRYSMREARYSEIFSRRRPDEN